MKKNDHRHENAHRILKAAGYAKGGKVYGKMQVDNTPHPDAEEDKEMIEKMVKPKALKSGYVNGGAPKKRLDKPSRSATPVQMARGGATKKKGSKTQVNVIVTGKGGQQTPMPVPMPAAAMPPRPMPPAAMPAGAPPAGAMPQHPGMKRGGKIHMTAGAGGGLGRLEKAKQYGGKPLKKGGKC